MDKKAVVHIHNGVSFFQVIVIGIILTLSMIITNYYIRKENVNYSRIILRYSIGHRIILSNVQKCKQTILTSKCFLTKTAVTEKKR